MLVKKKVICVLLINSSQELRIADCGLRIVDCGLRIVDCGLWFGNWKLETGG
jgi:hypothetical protein